MKTPRMNNRVVILLALVCTTGAHAADLSGFDKANGLYEGKKFDEAKAGYDQLIKSGPLSANLFYNRGNAEWRLGDGGHAVADYERALALEPSHPQARVNLDFAREQLGSKTAVPQWWERALGFLTQNAASILLAAAAWGAVFCLAIALLGAGSRGSAIAVMMVCILLAGYAGGSLWQAKKTSSKAIVVVQSAQARVAPADVAPIQDVLPAGSEVLAPETRGAWTWCLLPDGSRAWIPSNAIENVRPG